MANPTIKTIAQRAGVSVATVSKALNDMPDISQETKAHIHAIASELGYTTNKNARALVTGSSQSVGVILPDIIEPYCAQMVKGLSTRLGGAGYAFYLSSTGGNPHVETSQILTMLQQGVGALIVFPGGETTGHIVETASNHVPVIYVGHAPESGPVHAVLCRELSGGQLAARHLWHMGHRHVCVLTSSAAQAAFAPQMQGFSDYFAAHGGVTELYTCMEDRDEETAGVYFAQNLVRQNSPVTGIFASSDALAMGVMTAFSAMGRTVPRDLSVIGYGDTPASSLSLVNLTTVHLPYDEMGIHAGDMALGCLRDGHLPPVTVMLEPHLCKRGTVRLI